MTIGFVEVVSIYLQVGDILISSGEYQRGYPHQKYVSGFIPNTKNTIPSKIPNKRVSIGYKKLNKYNIKLRYSHFHNPNKKE
jgi:hypothetical protein